MLPTVLPLLSRLVRVCSGRMRLRVLAVVAVVALSGCAEAQRLATELAGGDGGGETSAVNNRDKRADGRDDGHFMYPAGSDDYCTGIFSSVSIPCRDVLLVCSGAIGLDGERVAIQMAAFYRCGSRSPVLAEACAEQPQYADFYACDRLIDT